MAVTPNYGWPVPVATDYVKDGWEAISDLGNAIDTTVAGLGSGLTKVSTTTLTASAGQAITGLSAGSRYRILLSVYGSVSDERVNMYFREGTTNKATSYYGGSFYVSPTASGVFTQANNFTEMFLARMSTTADKLSFANLDLDIGANGNSASIAGTVVANYSGNYNLFCGFNNYSMATCDGFFIYPSSGTMTGTLTVYKYQD